MRVDGPQPPRPAHDAPALDASAVTKAWLLELVAAAPLERAASVPVARLADAGPGVVDALDAALRSEAGLARLAAGGSARALAGGLAREAGAPDAARAVAAVEALRRVVAAAHRRALDDPDPDLADRLAHVCAVLAGAAVAPGEAGAGAGAAADAAPAGPARQGGVPPFPARPPAFSSEGGRGVGGAFGPERRAEGQAVADPGSAGAVPPAGGPPPPAAAPSAGTPLPPSVALTPSAGTAPPPTARATDEAAAAEPATSVAPDGEPSPPRAASRLRLPARPTPLRTIPSERPPGTGTAAPGYLPPDARPWSGPGATEPPRVPSAPPPGGWKPATLPPPGLDHDVPGARDARNEGPWLGAIGRAVATGRAFSVLLVEVRDLDRIVAAGDAEPALERVERAVGAQLVGADMLVRERLGRVWVLVPHADREVGRQTAVRLAAAASQAAELHGVPLTVAIGVAAHGEDGHTAEALVGAAEDGLLTAQAAGLPVG